MQLDRVVARGDDGDERTQELARARPIAGLVQRDEEFLGVAVETALARLIRRDFHEGIVAAFLAHAQLQRSEVTREGA